MPMLDPRQVLGQGLTTGALASGFRRRRAASFASGDVDGNVERLDAYSDTARRVMSNSPPT